MSDFNFMKSGFSLTQNNNEEECDQNTINLITSMMKVLIDETLKTAYEYCTHAGRKMITGEDVIYSMKYQTHQILKRKDLNDQIDNYMNEESDEEDEESDDENEDLSNEPEEEFKRSECDCEMCKNIHEYVDGWETWIPEDPIYLSFKESVNKAQQLYK